MLTESVATWRTQELDNVNLFFIDIEELSCGEDFVLAYEAIFFLLETVLKSDIGKL